MPTKKKVWSGLDSFIREKRDWYRQNGYDYKTERVALMHHKDFQALPAAERERYKEMAREFRKTDECKAIVEKSKKFVDPPPLEGRAGRKDTTGVPLEERVDPLELFKEKREHDVECLTMEWAEAYSNNLSGLLHELFYVIGVEVSVFDYEGEEISFYPAELAIVEFSLADGITNTLHKFVEPSLPSGLAAEARIKAAQTHRIDPMEFDHFDFHYHEMFQEILAFCQPWRNADAALQSETASEFSHSSRSSSPSLSQHNTQDPRLFCLWDRHPSIMDCLKLIKSKTRDPEAVANRLTHIFCAEDLAKCFTEWISASYTDVEITTNLRSSKFEFTENTRCWFHDNLDVPFCALGTAKRVVFHLLEMLREPFNLTFTVRHVPEWNKWQQANMRAAAGVNPSSHSSAASEVSVAPGRGRGRGRIAANANSGNRRRRFEDTPPMVFAYPPAEPPVRIHEIVKPADSQFFSEMLDKERFAAFSAPLHSSAASAISVGSITMQKQNITNEEMLAQQMNGLAARSASALPLGAGASAAGNLPTAPPVAAGASHVNVVANGNAAEDRSQPPRPVSVPVELGETRRPHAKCRQAPPPAIAEIVGASGFAANEDRVLHVSSSVTTVPLLVNQQQNLQPSFAGSSDSAQQPMPIPIFSGSNYSNISTITVRSDMLSNRSDLSAGRQGVAGAGQGSKPPFGRGRSSINR